MNRIFMGIFALIFFVCNVCAAYAPDGHLLVTMLNIGQGDAALIETPTQNVLVDTGDISSRNKLVGELNLRGITRLEKVILTHSHADHIGGLQAVIDNFTVDEIFDNGKPSNSPLYKKYRTADIKISTLKAGDILNLGGNVQLDVLFPYKFFTLDKLNNQSIVAMIRFADFNMLLTGDIESDAEDFLLDKNIRAQVLKAPHHGSKSSSTPNFIANVKPQFVLISAGKNNKFGHPHKQSLQNYIQGFVLPQNIFCTAFNGNISVSSDGFNFVVTPDSQPDWLTDYIGAFFSVKRI